MSFPRLASSIAQSWERFRDYRRTVAELNALDDRALADLDIGRHEIRRVARAAIG